MAAQGAELKLRVSLDLAALRNQLNTIGTQLSGQALPLAVKFDKSAIEAEYRKLSRFLNKTLRINVEGNLDLLPKKIETLKAQLAELEKAKIDVGVGAVKSLSKRDAAKVRSDIASEILGGENKIYLGASIKPKISRADARDFENAVKSKLAGLKVAVGVEPLVSGKPTTGGQGNSFTQAKLKTLGDDIKTLYKALGDAGLIEFDQSIANNKGKIVKALADIGQDVIAGLLNGLKSENPRIKAVAEGLGTTLITTFKTLLGIASPSKVFKGFGEDVGKGFEIGATSAMDKAFDAIEALMRQRMRVLDTIARGVFRLAGVDPGLIKRTSKQRRLPPAIDWPAQGPPQRPFSGPSSTGRLLQAGTIPAALSGHFFS
jgi:hypothetical protein